jgi:hypothetical protein
MTPKRVILTFISFGLIAAISQAVIIQLQQEPPAQRPEKKAVPPSAPSACENTYKGDGSPRLVANSQTAGSIPVPNGFRVTFPDLTWAGLWLNISPTTCDYTVELDARMLETSSYQAGWGYGIGVCDRWEGQVPSGFLLQYTFVRNDGRAVDNSARFAMPYVNDGERVAMTVDGITHHWIVTLKDSLVTISFDWGPPLGPFPVTRRPNGPSFEQTLPEDCKGSGAFLRVLGTTVEFTNISVRGVT